MNIPQGVEVEGVEGWHRRDSGHLHPVENWLIERGVFGEFEIRRIPRADLSNDGLGLIFSNGENPFIISLVRGMDYPQLNRFKIFGLSEDANSELARMNQRWCSDEMYFKHLSQSEFFMYEYGRNMRLFAEARAYFVLDHRGNGSFNPGLDNWEISYQI